MLYMKMDIYGKVFFIGEIIAILLISFHFEYYVGLITLFFPISCIYIYEYELKDNLPYWGYWILSIIFTYTIHTVFFEPFNSYSSIVNFLFYSWAIFWPLFLFLHFMKIYKSKSDSEGKKA